MQKNFNFKKKFGQNFLKDNNILEKIVNSVNITNDDLVIEIGPGSGALTKYILGKTKKVICFEIDKDLHIYLDKYQDEGAIIIYEDFLKINLNNYIKNITYNNLYIISNLPYYITTPIITKIIYDNIDITSCVFMMQKEVGDRFNAKVGTKSYNSLSIFIDYYFTISKVCDVSRNSFYPVPNVDSTVLLFNKRKNKKVYATNEALFFKLIKDAFTYKRKTIKNNLKNYDLTKIEQTLNKYNLDLNVRAENLSIEIFADISNNI